MARVQSRLDFKNVQDLPSKTFVCGHCSTEIASERGWDGYEASEATHKTRVYLCHKCTRPNFFDWPDIQIPGPMFGASIEGIEDQSVSGLYDEARRAYSASSYTAVVLCCRKLLMHIAVSKGAPEGRSFVDYVSHLGDHNYVPPDAQEWVDHIRKMGNEANHEIALSSREDAAELISFCEMLLKVIFEFPAAVRKRHGTPKT